MTATTAKQAKHFKLEDGDIFDLNLSGARIPGANLSNMLLNYANFSSSDVSKGDFSNSDIENSNFKNANLNSANFKGSNLSGADFSGANLNEADFRGANLTGVIFSYDTSTIQTNFAGADLQEVFGISAKHIEDANTDDKTEVSQLMYNQIAELRNRQREFNEQLMSHYLKNEDE